MTRGWLLFIAICALVVLAGVVWLEYRRTQQAAEDEFEHELDLEFGGSNGEATTAETLPPLPPEDLVGADTGGDPGSETASSGGVSQDVPAADAAGSGAAADAPAQRLTPAQRRRAVKKGRIPRDLPGRDSPRPAGQPDLPSPAPALATARYGAGEFHPHHERIPQPIEVYDPMMRAWMPVFPTLLESARHEAHFRQWETEVGGLIDGAYAWLETAA